jgi:hypothetical protein
LQQLEDGVDAAPAADHPDIPRGLADDLAQGVHIVRMRAGDQHDVGRRRDRNIVQGRGEVVHDDAIGVGKAFGIGEGRSIVHDHHFEIEQFADLRDGHRHVSRTDHHQRRLRDRQVEENHDFACPADDRIVIRGEAIGSRLRFAALGDRGDVGQRALLQQGPGKTTLLQHAVDDQELFTQACRQTPRTSDDSRGRGRAMPSDGVQHAAGHIHTVAVPGLDEDIEDAAADAVRGHRNLVCQIDDDHPRLFVGEDLERRPPDLRLAAPTADGTIGRAIGFDQHSCADFPRRAAFGAHDRGDRDIRLGLERPAQRFVELAWTAQTVCPFPAVTCVRPLP